jgi:hypothetical protein
VTRMVSVLWFALAVTVGLPVAALAQGAGPVERVAFDYSALYERLNPAIVKVFADSASGSGFLVSRSGLIATNHHVVRNARYLAVQFADGRKVLAAPVLLDAQFDLAVLKVHRDVAAGIEPLALLPSSRDHTLKPGVPVLAFGSPLSQTFLMTQGIIAKVEAQALLGDFLIQSGNSGGPLVSLEGEVVGINTFAERNISGAVPVRVLRRALESDEVAGYDQPDPPADQLPRVRAERYPTDLLKELILREPLDLKAYQMDGGKFTLTTYTPVLVGKMQVRDDMLQAQNRLRRRGKKVNDPSWREVDTPFYEWMRNATSLLDYAVTFEVKPDFGTTTGSKFALFAAAFASGVSKTPTPVPHQNVEFKAEFQEVRLYRDGELITPITPGRAVTEAAFEGQNITFVDEAYSGVYVYDPEVFLTGRHFKLEIYDAREPGRPHKVLVLTPESRLLRQIRSDFAKTTTGSDTGTE